MRSKQFNSEETACQSESSEITDEAREHARKTAFYDTIQWGKIYRKYLEQYREEARLIINDKVLANFSKSNEMQSLELDESMFFDLPSPSMFTGNDNNNPEKKGDSE
ncbi:MAG: hypothetical protein F6K24_02110 [Okeania sp. SIO2D1]|nr:hypothetical protein [Okeania sp. SIO2D1]